ncbi:MAG: zinc ribbon domain-containing protein, partial [Anaerolineae bacterium]|nr:zinc ribbon domain-containing protein [Anaerolineae bacterium]
MSDEIEFVSNYGDLSNDRGFQFEFHCNRCGTGYRTPFQAWAVGTAASVLDTASSLFGGIFGSAA